MRSTPDQGTVMSRTVLLYMTVRVWEYRHDNE